MGDVAVLVTRPQRERNTYRAMLLDTLEVMKSVKYATTADSITAGFQVEAIEELLTAEEPGS